LKFLKSFLPNLILQSFSKQSKIKSQDLGYGFFLNEADKIGFEMTFNKCGFTIWKLGQKSMCVSEKRWLQGRAATLLLLCGWTFLFLFCINAAKISCLIVSLFLPRLACQREAYALWRTSKDESFCPH